MADLETGARRANELRIHLNQLLSNQPVEMLAGNRVLEIRPYGVHKGRIIAPMSAEREARTTMLAIGDDRTDEDLFASLPPGRDQRAGGPGSDPRALPARRHLGGARRAPDAGGRRAYGPTWRRP